MKLKERAPLWNKATRFSIDNQTKFSNREIRALLTRCFSYMRKLERGGLYYKIAIDVVPARKYVSGCASIGGWHMTLRLHPDCTRNKFIALTIHEIFHLYGYLHNQFRDWSTDDTIALIDVNHRGLLTVATSKPKSVIDLPLKRYSSVVSRIKQWEAKERRAATALKKLRRQRRDYERRLTAAGKL